VSQEEYAIDLYTPPVLCRLPNLISWRVCMKTRRGRRPPTSCFLNKWRERFNDSKEDLRSKDL